MAAQVKSLAETVRQMRAAIAQASNVAASVQSEAAELVGNMAAVQAVAAELKSANADLKGALGEVTNGGDPLGGGGSTNSSQDLSTPPEAPTAPVTGAPAADLHAAKLQVETANAEQARVAAVADKYIPVR